MGVEEIFAKKRLNFPKLFASRLDGSAKQFRRKLVEEVRIPAPRKKAVIGDAAVSLGDVANTLPDLGLPLICFTLRESMNEEIKLKDTELQIIDLVVSRFISEKKPTPRKQLLLKFEDPDLLETLINHSLLRDVNRQAVLPGLLAFHFWEDVHGVQLAQESLHTVLHTLKLLYRESEEENKQITPAEIEAKARELGRRVNEHTVWLGLYLIQNYFGVLSSWNGDITQGQLNWLTVNEGVLRYRNPDSVWEERMKQERHWLRQRAPVQPAAGFQELDETETFPVGGHRNEQKQRGLLIFISHSSKDAEIALSLIELLKAALNLRDKQIRCTSIDGFKLPAGANTDDVLKAEVRQAYAFIGLITPNSLTSAYVLFELGARWGAGLHMVPVLAGVGPEALQGPLKGINSISADQIAQLHQLLSDLADTLDLELQSAAGYERYAQKLIDQVRQSYEIVSTPTLSQNAHSRQFHQEWKDLAAKFESLSRDPLSMHVRADWQCQRNNNRTIHESWDLTGVGNHTQVEAICLYAGTLLAKSPTVIQQLPDPIKTEENPVWRWLFFLKGTSSYFKHDSSCGKDDNGTLYLMGSLRDVAAASVNACIKCAAAEMS